MRSRGDPVDTLALEPLDLVDGRSMPLLPVDSSGLQDLSGRHWLEIRLLASLQNNINSKPF
jgi:hypothetical protein